MQWGNRMHGNRCVLRLVWKHCQNIDACLQTLLKIVHCFEVADKDGTAWLASALQSSQEAGHRMCYMILGMQFLKSKFGRLSKFHKPLIWVMMLQTWQRPGSLSHWNHHSKGVPRFVQQRPNSVKCRQLSALLRPTDVPLGPIWFDTNQFSQGKWKAVKICYHDCRAKAKHRFWTSDFLQALTYMQSCLREDTNTYPYIDAYV